MPKLLSFHIVSFLLGEDLKFFPSKMHWNERTSLTLSLSLSLSLSLFALTHTGPRDKYGHTHTHTHTQFFRLIGPVASGNPFSLFDSCIL